MVEKLLCVATGRMWPVGCAKRIVGVLHTSEEGLAWFRAAIVGEPSKSSSRSHSSQPGCLTTAATFSRGPSPAIPAQTLSRFSQEYQCVILAVLEYPCKHLAVCLPWRIFVQTLFGPKLPDTSRLVDSGQSFLGNGMDQLTDDSTEVFQSEEPLCCVITAQQQPQQNPNNRRGC